MDRKTPLLLVEDEVILRLYMRDNLEKLGFANILEAGDAEKAVSLAKESRPEVIFMDIRLNGDKTGIDAAREIVGEYRPAIYLMSAYDPESFYSDRDAEIFAGFYAKPVPDEVFTTILTS